MKIILDSFERKKITSPALDHNLIYKSSTRGPLNPFFPKNGALEYHLNRLFLETRNDFDFERHEDSNKTTTETTIFEGRKRMIQESMNTEVSAAARFITSTLYGKLPRRRADLFGGEFEIAVKKKFQGHWYPEEPARGSAHRCINFTSKEVDPVFHQAAESASIAFSEIKENLPAELRIWIDPDEVSYQIGEKGTTSILYKKKGAEIEYGADITASVQPQVSPIRAQHQRVQYQQRPLMTVDEFMSTKFGSMKNRGARRGQHSSTHRPPAYPAPGSPTGFTPQQQQLHQQQSQNMNAHNLQQAANLARAIPQSLQLPQLSVQQIQLLQQQLLLQQLANSQQQQQSPVQSPVESKCFQPFPRSPINPNARVFEPQVQLHQTPSGGLSPSYSFNSFPPKADSESSLSSSFDSLKKSSSYNFEHAWRDISSSPTRWSPTHSDPMHSGDDSGFDNASVDEEADLDPLFLNHISSLRIET
ncbi:Oidioi.mRNA.OKI2018_I69.PAR.g12643.t1.cds [Oikopleura dioica]|uniref:Oidioi.mRNA.OKI2018_I69.PAR.g12643.t1.cds n=1 Tax=Oikopleura dioica TaxID=34765 RepID=A0ABN7S6F1_OIKDI|nr:Oidioi.mRNA.OKI2018_I69.PAR.g12643.t1.cds [Oikopleura dioica]